MTIQLDFPKLPRLDDISIKAVAMIVVSKVDRSKAKHNLTCRQMKFLDGPFPITSSRRMDIRKDDKPEMPSCQNGIRVNLGIGGRTTTILFCRTWHRR